MTMQSSVGKNVLKEKVYDFLNKNGEIFVNDYFEPEDPSEPNFNDNPDYFIQIGQSDMGFTVRPANPEFDLNRDDPDVKSGSHKSGSYVRHGWIFSTYHMPPMAKLIEWIGVPESGLRDNSARINDIDLAAQVSDYIVDWFLDKKEGATTSVSSKEDETPLANLNELKYKLKLPVQPTTEPAPADSFGPENAAPEMGAPKTPNDNQVDTNPFEDEPFDAGVDADEESDPKHFIQQLAGKLGTTIRTYTETQGAPDFELEKFAINSVISATHTAEMNPKDQKEIINKIKESGQGDETAKDTDAGDDIGKDGGEDIPNPENQDTNQNPDDDFENEEIVLEIEENITKNLPMGENFGIFVENSIMEQINKQMKNQFLIETVDEVFGMVGTKEEPDAPTVEPDTEKKEKEPETSPTRRNKPWKTPKIEENPDPKAQK